MSRLKFALWIALGAAAQAGEWSSPVAVTHDDKTCLSYRARLSGDFLVIQAVLQPGWHTFAMDNDKRAEEKLAGRQSLGIDQPTAVKASGGLEVAGPWRQSPPKDFSRPELRWFSWGYEGEALFAAKVRRSGSGPARIAIRGQACTDSTCKNVDIALSLPIDNEPGSAAFDLKSLVPVR